MMASADVDGKIGCHEPSPIQEKATKGMTTSNGSQNLNGMQHRATPTVGFSLPPTEPLVAKPGLSSMREEEEEDGVEVPWDNELSAEAQAHNISMFLSSSTSGDSGEEATVSETVITSVYRDPLSFCMDGIEEMARQILKTGKLTTTGEPGDMSKIQPALFSLQATEKEMGQLISQLLQTPLFFQGEPGDFNVVENMDDEDEPFMTVINQDDALANGSIRVAIPVDTAIYTLLRSHCAKGARQAEEVINTAMKNSYIPAQNAFSATMPPIVKFNSAPRRRSSSNTLSSSNGTSQQSPDTIREYLALNKDSTKQVSTSSISTDEWSTTASAKLSTHSSMSMHTSYGSLPGSEASASETSLTSMVPGEDAVSGVRSTSPYMEGMPPTHKSISRLSSNDSTGNRRESLKEEGDSTTTTPKHKALVKTLSSTNKVRRTSTVLQPPVVQQRRSRGDSTASDISLSDSTSRLVPGSHRWNTSILENNTIVAQYGSDPYPIVWWEPSFKVDFRLSTSVGLLSGTVTGIDPGIPEVTLKVFNHTAKQIGFAIRSHRQSTVFSSRVVFPTKGLQILEPHKIWEDNVEFYSNTPNTAEMFVIDLFFCTMDSKPMWNIVRKYAIMKAQKSPGNLRRTSKRRQSHLQLPGAREVKAMNLELVLSHGLQCVVKGKLSEAEIIFTQALYLPDFQRVPLKAFVFICLAVIANKRIKQGQGTSLTPIMLAVESSSRLVSICELGSGSTKMPYTLQLVKQLKKELNLPKLMKDFKRPGPLKGRKIDDTVAEEFKDITSETGGELEHRGTKVIIPPGALPQTTNISLSLAGSRQLSSMLKASGWSKIVQVATAIHIECNPPLNLFNKPIKIRTRLPEGTNLAPTSMVRLMHSNYLRHWEDITDDVISKITVSGEEVSMETNLTGWLAVSVIQFDASMIAQMVLKSITVEPIMLRLSVFGFIDAERKSIQVAIFAVPCKANEEPIHKDIDKPENFIPISFPHIVQAFPNEKLQVDIQGTFEPDVSLGEKSLSFEMDVQQKHNQVHTKWVKSTSACDLPPSGKLNVSSCRNNSSNWETIASISLSMRTNLNCSSPKESTSSGE